MTETYGKVILITNYGSEPLTIINDACYLEDDDYEFYDRYLSLTNSSGSTISSQTINPGRSAYVYFRVIGDPTWYDMYTRIYYSFEYDSVEYYAFSSYYYGDAYAEV